MVAGNPAVPLAQQADKERPAVLDLSQADLQGPAPLGVLFRHAPAEIDIHEVKMSPGAPFPQFREHHAYQMIPLRVHVTERGGDEHADGFPGGGHGQLTW
jgi:hypothetical protein